MDNKKTKRGNGKEFGKHLAGDDARALAVADYQINGHQKAVAAKHGISDRSLRDYVQRERTDPKFKELVAEKKEAAGFAFLNLANKLIERYLEQVPQADLSNKGVILLGIVADKALAFLNQPTAITESRSEVVNVAAMKSKAERLLEKYKDLSNGNEDEALRMLREDDPDLASALMQ